MAETISVKSILPPTADGGQPVALWEVDAAHPEGEAYVAGPDPVEVAETSGVSQAINEGRIEKVGAEARREARGGGEHPTQLPVEPAPDPRGRK